jgi:ADP-ribose pyrophosphatase
MHIPTPQSRQPIPTNAQKVFQGEIFDVYQWQQEMFDGSFQTFEKLKRYNAASVIATLGNQIIVQKELQPGKLDWFYSLPAGGIESGEDVLSGAKRELLEESGHESDDWNFYFAFHPVSKVDYTDYYFIAKNCQKTSAQKLDSGEKIEVLMFGFDEFIELVMTDEFRDLQFKLKIMKMKIAGTLDELKSLIF